jgi:hypothetical protein
VDGRRHVGDVDAETSGLREYDGLRARDARPAQVPAYGDAPCIFLSSSHDLKMV